MRNERVFISYSRADLDKVKEIVRTLGHAGILCWMDLTGIESGTQFEETIIRAIDDSDVVLFMMSDNFVSSPWAKREVYYAEREGKRIVPVSIDGRPVRGWVKFHFGHVDWIDSTSKEQMSKLISNLQSWLNTDANPSLEAVDRPRPVRKTRWVLPIIIAAIALPVVFAIFLNDRRRHSDGGPEDSEPMADAVVSDPDSETHGIAYGHKWVDLGTDVKWADHNVGSFLIGDYGSYFAWGEMDTKSVFTLDNYECRNYPDLRLKAENDVANKLWGGTWRVPTKEDFEELLSACSMTWTSKNGHDGCLFTSKTTGESVFFPASGFRLDDLNHVGEYGYYWSSSLNMESPDVAWFLFFDSECARIGDRARYAGRTIRPVLP